MNDVDYYEAYHPEDKPRKYGLKAALQRAAQHHPPRKIWPIAITGAVLLATLPSLVVADHGGSLSIWTPAQARAKRLESLHRAVQQDGGVPLPENLHVYIKNRTAAVQLGKALFWDMQVGSDGIQACASCHYHAGTDNRTTNALNPDQGAFLDVRSDVEVLGYLLADFATSVRPSAFEFKPVNATLVREDYPFVKNIQSLTITAQQTVEPGIGNSNDITGSMGVFFNRFDGVTPGSAVDLGTSLPDPLFSIGSRNARRVVGRNTPSVINAVFNFTNFWDGRANPHFNGVNSFGDQVKLGNLWVNQPGVGLVPTTVSIDHASLASQAMSPPLTPVEMSFGDPSTGNSRRFREIAQKLLRPSPNSGLPLVPLGKQQVKRSDSVLGKLSQWPANGLSVSYETMIKAAFVDEYWNSTQLLNLGSTPAPTNFTQMEANFSLFFGLAIALYESTLVADQTPFDQWMQTGIFNSYFRRDALAGLNLFVNQGRCITCHSGPELTSASVRSAKGGKNLIRAMAMASGNALYDNGFYNISVTPTTDDAGRGSTDPLGQPVAFSQQALWKRLAIPQLPELADYQLPDIGFPIFGNEYIPALAENSGSPVCNDTNHNGKCESNEKILPEFQRVAVDGTFKTPGLRNVALTGPYFHNGGMATLRQVVQFYNRGGNFCSFNVHDLHPAIQPLGLTDAQEQQLVAFLVSLTDPRVKYQAAPFDHPELRIPENGLDTHGSRIVPAVGAFGHREGLGTFLNLDPQDPIYTPGGACLK